MQDTGVHSKPRACPSRRMLVHFGSHEWKHAVLESAEQLADWETEIFISESGASGPELVAEAVRRAVDTIVMGVGKTRLESEKGELARYVLRFAPGRVILVAH